MVPIIGFFIFLCKNWPINGINLKILQFFGGNSIKNQIVLTKYLLNIQYISIFSLILSNGVKKQVKIAILTFKKPLQRLVFPYIFVSDFDYLTAAAVKIFTMKKKPLRSGYFSAAAAAPLQRL